jgi:hypothetical protein
MLLTEIARISMRTVHTVTKAISVLKLSLSDMRYLSKATFFAFSPIAMEGVFSGLLHHPMDHLVCSASQWTVITSIDEQRI